ncbi:SxtJ family membrane protein [sulfur-oxidizing endosymbiont of Gigantopelta aegis]|uniref:SxtJ family membrane protein n=1 Tax=sulfur-oxidizing endosymbiont of Gigantopelta aegis TaxID=2794934 RepID=UPI0018DD5F65|nr:SxtJ family membrane protein [sulfur-oxidizing endosymbiont of Gigantopelta aegis]
MNNETKEIRQFAWIMSGMILVFFALLLPWVWNWAFSWTPYIISGVFALTGLLIPQLLIPVHKAWLKFAEVLGFINSRILLFIIFYLVLTPMGLVAKLFGFDPMKKKHNVDSYYIKREKILIIWRIHFNV